MRAAWDELHIFLDFPEYLSYNLIDYEKQLSGVIQMSQKSPSYIANKAFPLMEPQKALQKVRTFFSSKSNSIDSDTRAIRKAAGGDLVAVRQYLKAELEQ